MLQLLLSAFASATASTSASASASSAHPSLRLNLIRPSSVTARLRIGNRNVSVSRSLVWSSVAGECGFGFWVRAAAISEDPGRGNV